MLQLYRYLSEKNASAFIEKGEVLLRTLSYFRDYEDADIRADEHEGTLVHLPINGLKVNLVKSGESIDLPYRLESTAKEDQIFILCMSTELSPTIAKKFETPVAVEIINLVKFLALLRSSLSLRKRFRVTQLIHQQVKYYEWHEPPIIDWALPERIAMRKPKSLEWQNEYRFAVPINDAFKVENVSVKLVSHNAVRPARVESHPQLLIKLGNLSKICRLNKF